VIITDTRRRFHDGEGRQPTRGAVRTVEEVAAALGLSRQRVMQLEASALRKLRESRVLNELVSA
jgi:DNA-directed RNA polymerase sigma subunit (sigma70/sigma32)